MKLYIMVDPDKPNRCKVGITKNPDQRIRPYRTANPKCYFLKLWDVPHRVYEKQVLEEISHGFTVDREYVYCPPTLVQNIIEGFLVDRGVLQ